MTSITSLQKLVKLKEYALDERKRFVGRLNARLAAIESHRDALLQNLEEEKTVALQDLSTSLAYVGYASAVQEVLEKSHRLYREAQQQLFSEQEKLGVLYADLEATQKMLEAEIKKEKSIVEKKEQADMDDLYAQRLNR